MSKPRHLQVTTFAAAFALLSAPAFAHLTNDAHTHSAFATGFGHPLFGLDHLLAMVAVGIWAAQRGGRMTWALPLTFVAVMTIGGLLGMGGVGIPLVEPGIAASVLILGLLIATAARTPAWMSLALVALFALFHGHAHGTEFPAGQAAAVYTIGFALATALLHALGISAALLTTRLAASAERRDMMIRVGGGLVTAAGVFLAAGVL